MLPAAVGILACLRIESAVTSVRLIGSVDSIVAGRPIPVGIELKLKPGWHVYWRNPGDSGQEVQVAWSLPPGWKASELISPPPEIIVDSGVVSFAYRDNVTLACLITPSKPRHATVTATVEWLVCSETCVAGSKKVSLQFPLPQTQRPLPRDRAQVVRVLASRPEPVGGVVVLSGKTISLTVGRRLDGGSWRFLPYDRAVLDYSATPTYTADGAGSTIALKVSDYFDRNATKRLRGILARYNNGVYQGNMRLEIDAPIQPSGETR